eukprot:TRINITY_DN11210_c0_g1_i5.p1 TRINITY_DN11210_c0_g1~~TRINITY_DN11210_c0_g1_i5.p1  ORF type:complete len:149 (-),score=14.28 TRINITY_DN11210_c0_g1_i5:169-615(-)
MCIRDRDNILNIYCEVVTLFTFVSTLIINLLSFAEKAMEIYGWFLVAIVLSALVFCWTLIVPTMVKTLYKEIISTVRRLLEISKKITKPSVKNNTPNTNNSTSEAKGSKKFFVASKHKGNHPKADPGKPAKTNNFDLKSDLNFPTNFL